MPIHDLGYRAWPGKYSSDWLRFWVIATSGIRVAARNTWLKRVLLAAWLPTFALAVIMFGYERLIENQKVALTSTQVRSTLLNEIGDEMQDGEAVIEALSKENLHEGRHLMWSWLLSTYLRVPQAVMAMLVIGMIAPPLISKDVRTRAFLMYFSKPIGRVEYLLGKMLVVAAYLVFITTTPALGCYVFGVALSSDLNVLADTWDLPLRIVLASLVFIIPSVSIALMFSSLTSESRFAAFAWFAFWGLGFIAWNVTYGVMTGQVRQAAQAQREHQPEPPDLQKWLDEAVKRGVIQPSELVAPPAPLRPGARLTDEQYAAIETQRRRFEQLLRKVEAFGFTDPEKIRIEAQIAESQKRIAKHPMSLVSLYDTLVRLQRWIFGLEKDWSAIIPSLLVVVGVTLFAWVVLLRNVSASIRV